MSTSAHYAEPGPETDDLDADRLLETLGDADCRAILEAATEPRTAGEFADVCDLPSSTAYRKVDDMHDSGLLEERTRIDTGGHHASEYVRAVESVTVVPTTDGSTDLDVEWRDDARPGRTGISLAPADD